MTAIYHCHVVDIVVTPALSGYPEVKISCSIRANFLISEANLISLSEQVASNGYPFICLPFEYPGSAPQVKCVT